MAPPPNENDRFELTRRELLGGSAAAALTLALPGCHSAVPPRTGPAAGGNAKAALERFGVSDALAREVMARALQSGGEFCDMYFQQSRVNYLGVQDHAVNRAYSKAELGVGVRVVRGVETGYAFSESLDRGSMLQAAEVAASVASGAARSVPRAFSVGAVPRYYPHAPVWGAVETKRKLALLQSLDAAAAARDSRVKKINISYRDEEHFIVVLDAEGRAFADYQPMTVCYLTCVAEHKGRRESNYAALAGRAGVDFYDEGRCKRIVGEAVDRTLVLFDAVEGPVGELPVVLGPGSSGILLHEAIGHGMEADFARSKMTIFTDKIGKKVAESFVTIVDDGTLPGLRGSIHGDDEGNGSERTVLVEGGVLRSFMHDRISAHHFKHAPTGNGRRQSFRHVPMPRMRNTYMLAGPHARDEVIRSVKKGVYAEHFTNGQVRIGAGDYSFYVKNGLLIEDGKLTRPIKDINIIGNGPESLARVTMVANDFALDEGGWTCGKNGQGVPVGLGMPTVKVSSITVGGTKKG